MKEGVIFKPEKETLVALCENGEVKEAEEEVSGNVTFAVADAIAAKLGEFAANKGDELDSKQGLRKEEVSADKATGKVAGPQAWVGFGSCVHTFIF